MATVVDPTKLTGDAERAYRQANPNSDYTKSVDMRYLNRIADAIKNNTGVSQAQMNQYNDVASKWNVNPVQSNQVNSIYDQQVKAATDAWNAQKDQAVADINFQKQKVAPQYQGLRNQADVVNLQNAKRLQELMASRGLGSSGENVTATVNQNNARQRSLNDLNAQEQATLNEFDHQIASVSNPAQLQAQLAQINAQRAQATLDQSNWQKQFDYTKNVDDRNYNYQVGRDAVGDKQWQDQFNYGKSQDALQQQNWQKQFDAQNAQWQKEFDQNAKQFGQNYALQKMQFDLDKKVQLGQLSIDQARLALSQAAASRSGSSSKGSSSKSSASSGAKSSAKPLPSTPQSQALQNTYQLYQNIMANGAKGKTSTAIFKGQTPMAY